MRRARSLEEFQRISAYLKTRHARTQRAAEIDAAWSCHVPPRSSRLLRRRDGISAAAARKQLSAKFEAQNGACFYCECATWLPLGDPEKASRRRKQTMATREHLKRRTDGGSDDDENIVMACSDCNSRRDDTPVEEWKKIRRGLKTAPTPRVGAPHSKNPPLKKPFVFKGPSEDLIAKTKKLDEQLRAAMMFAFPDLPSKARRADRAIVEEAKRALTKAGIEF